jgi:hypothetical protein
MKNQLNLSYLIFNIIYNIIDNFMIFNLWHMSLPMLGLKFSLGT